MDQPRAGTHYPRSLGEFQAWLRTDEDCLDYLDYLEWLRWPRGFACPGCGQQWGLAARHPAPPGGTTHASA